MPFGSRKQPQKKFSKSELLITISTNIELGFAFAKLKSRALGLTVQNKKIWKRKNAVKNGICPHKVHDLTVSER